MGLCGSRELEAQQDFSELNAHRVQARERARGPWRDLLPFDKHTIARRDIVDDPAVLLADNARVLSGDADILQGDVSLGRAPEEQGCALLRSRDQEISRRELGLLRGVQHREVKLFFYQSVVLRFWSV